MQTFVWHFVCMLIALEKNITLHNVLLFLATYIILSYFILKIVIQNLHYVWIYVSTLKESHQSVILTNTGHKAKIVANTMSLQESRLFRIVKKIEGCEWQAYPWKLRVWTFSKTPTAFPQILILRVSLYKYLLGATTKVFSANFCHLLQVDVDVIQTAHFLNLPPTNHTVHLANED